MTERPTPPTGRFATEANLLKVIHEARFAGGLAASGQRAGFGGNLFTRDSCRMMRDTMEHLPSMTRELLAILPQIQGVSYDGPTNEQPDFLPHQWFRQITGGRSLPDKQVATAEYWAGIWGVDMQANEHEGKWFAVYNSSDGPPLYVITLAEFCRLPEGRQVLSDTYIHRPTGEKRTVAEAGLRCVNAIMSTLEQSKQSGHGLYAVPNTNPKQTSPSGVMRDGFDAYYYPEGQAGRPLDYQLVAYIDNQALAFEALQIAATELYPDHEDSRKWIAAAEELRRRALTAFWMEDQQCFAAAVDSSGEQVQLESNAALEILNGPFLKDTPEGPDYVTALVRWLYDDKVMTPIGPRMLHQKFDKYEGDYYAYQGSGAVWPCANRVIAKGLRSHGLVAPSHDLGLGRTLGWLNRAGEAVENGYVERETNQPCYSPYPTAVHRLGHRALAAELGQLDQGWTATAGLGEIWDWRRGGKLEQRGTWQYSLSREVLKVIRDIPPASTDVPALPIFIDQQKGRQLRLERGRRMGLDLK